MVKNFSSELRNAKCISRRRTSDQEKLSFQSLEARRLLAALTVNSLADTNFADAELTLRESVLLVNNGGDANAALGRPLTTGEAAQVDFTEAFGTNDKITFDSALSGETITLTGSQLQLTESVTIDASAFATRLTIDADARSRIFNITATSGDFRLRGLELINGFTRRSGGAVRITNGDLIVEDSVISGSAATNRWGGGIYAQSNADISLLRSTVSGNRAEWGGGILGYGGIEIVDSTISNNVAEISGGGLYGDDTIVISNSTISGNSATNGGGIYNRAAATITSSTISDNSATYGGGIYSRATATITNSTVSGNFSVFGGGGIYNNGTATITNSTVSGNSADQYSGGGVYNLGTATITNSTLSGNSADYGGGIYNDVTATITITNSTLSGNSADYAGGGIYGLGTTTITNSIVANSPLGTDIAGVGFNGSHNLIGDGSNLSSFTDSISGDPMLGPLADNGGATQTHALLTDSPAIDGGNNALAVDTSTDPLVSDQRGAEFDRIFGGTVDIGAYEFAPSAFVLGDVNQDGIVDFSDIPSFISALQAGEFLDEADINGDGVVDFADISFFIELLLSQ